MADVTIDKVTLEIEAKATDANKLLSELERNLKNVKRALTGFDVSGLSKLQSTLDNIEKKSQRVTKSKVIPDVDTSKLERAEKKISSEVDKIQDKFSRLKTLEIAAKGGDSSALTSWKRLATSLQGDLDVLENKFKRLDKTIIPSDAFLKLAEQEEVVNNKLDTLKAKMNDVLNGKINISDNAFNQLKEDIAESRGELQRISEAQTDMIAKGEHITDPIQKYRDTAFEIQEALDKDTQSLSTFSAETKKSFSDVLIQNTANEISKVGKVTVDTTKKLLSMGGNAVRKVFNGLSNSIHKVKDALSSTGAVSNKFNNFMNKGFMRVLKYGFGIRSLYVGFRRLRKAIVDSFGELQKSGAFYETTRANIEALKSSLLLLKYQFGAAFEPIFNTVAPALKTFIDHILQATNAFSAFTAKLMGKDSYSKAVMATEEVEDNVSGAAKAAKELKKQLQGFDELNNLTSNNGGKGNGSGSGDADSNAVTYVSESVDNALGDFGKELAKKIREGDWGGVGTAISEKLTAQLQIVNGKWPEIFANAADFGSKIAEFFKGLIKPELFSEIGTAVGSALKAALIATFSFAETMAEVNEETGRTGWQQLGDSIAAGLNAFMETKPFENMATTFNALAKGMLSALGAAIIGIKWDQIGNDIAAAIKKIDAKDIGWELGNIANSLVNAFYTLVSNKDIWSNIGQKIADGINGFFAGMSEIDPKTGLTGFEAFAKSITEVVTGLADTISTALENIEWEKVGDGINKIWSEIEWKKITASLTRLKDALKEALKGLLKGMDISAGDIILGLTGVSLVIESIVGIKLASSITAAALSALIKTAVTSLFTGGGTAAAAGGAAAAGTTAAAGAAGAASGLAVSIGGILLSITGVTVAMAAAATIGWSFGKTFGDFIATWLADQGIISKSTQDEYTAINEMSIIQKIKDIKLAAGTVDEKGKSDLRKGLELAIDEMYGPVFDEGKSIVANLQAKISLVQDGWTTVTEWVKSKGSTAVSSAISLAKNFGSGISDVAGWVKNQGATAVSSAVSLVKNFGSDINTVYDWIRDADQWGGAVKKKIELARSDGWTTVKGWIENAARFGGDVSKKIGLARNGWDTVTSWINKNFNTDAVKAYVNLVKDKWKSITSFIFGKANQTIQKSQQVVKVGIKLVKTGWSSLKSFFGLKGGGIVGANGAVKAFADGGIISRSLWNSLPKYASGTNKAHGSLFVAGESGPEIMGHINGRTEVLNKSQIAATMYSAIYKGMAQFRNAQMVQPSSPRLATEISNGIVSGINNSSDNSLLIEQNRLIAEQNRLLQQIANKNVTISSRDVFNATRAEAQNYNNRTGNSPFLF